MEVNAWIVSIKRYIIRITLNPRICSILNEVFLIKERTYCAVIYTTNKKDLSHTFSKLRENNGNKTI